VELKLTEYELGELLIYEQPTAYIVNSTEYSDSYKTPVLTAGKSFILGYTNETDNIFGKLPVILFDDFTTATQFVNFEFKVKSSAMKILNVNTELVNPKYIFYRMQTIQFDHSTHKRYWIQQYSKLKVQIPPIVEQERIVAKIEELFSDLDNAVETLKATKAQLKLYKQAVLKSAFSRCIELKKAEDLCFFITKGTTPKKAEFQLEDKSIPFIKVYNLTFDGSLDFTIEPTFIAKSIHETSLARSIVYPGDVLMNIVGPPMGKVSIVPSSYDEWNINQAIARFRCKEELNNRYLAYFLMSSETVEKMSKQTKATAGQFNLTLETCRNIDIPVCSINEQLKIVDNLDTQLTAYNNIEKTVNDALQQATSMRQSILKKAFEGRL
jgi:putative phosphoribosylformylglycinamidine synthase (fragment)